MKEYHWSARIGTLEGGMLIIRGGIHESEQSDRAAVEEEIRSIVAGMYPHVSREDITIDFGS